MATTLDSLITHLVLLILTMIIFWWQIKQIIASSNLTFKQGTLLKASGRKAQEKASFGILLAFVWIIKGVLLSLITIMAEFRFYHRMVNFYLNLETVDREDLAVLAHVSIRRICLSFPNGEIIA